MLLQYITVVTLLTCISFRSLLSTWCNGSTTLVFTSSSFKDKWHWHISLYSMTIALPLHLWNHKFVSWCHQSHLKIELQYKDTIAILYWRQYVLTKIWIVSQLSTPFQHNLPKETFWVWISTLYSLSPKLLHWWACSNSHSGSYTKP